MFANVNELEAVIIGMFFISLYGLVSSNNMMKSIVFTVLMEAAVIMFFLSIGYSTGILSPIGDNVGAGTPVADPLPQALMITAVIIGLTSTVVAITMFITLFRQHRVADWDAIRQASEEETM